jgi:hypothetical protein
MSDRVPRVAAGALLAPLCSHPRPRKFPIGWRRRRSWAQAWVGSLRVDSAGVLACVLDLVGSPGSGSPGNRPAPGLRVTSTRGGCTSSTPTFPPSPPRAVPWTGAPSTTGTRAPSPGSSLSPHHRAPSAYLNLPSVTSRVDLDARGLRRYLFNRTAPVAREVATVRERHLHGGWPCPAARR